MLFGNDVIERLELCISMGSVEAAVHLLHQHREDQTVIDCVRELDDIITVMWVYYGTVTSALFLAAADRLGELDAGMQKPSELPLDLQDRMDQCIWELTNGSCRFR